MKNKFLNSEILLPLLDYNKIEGRKENLTKSIIFVVIALTVGWFMLYYSNSFIEEFDEFVLEYIAVEIGIVTLLLSFNIACLTILITANGQNVKRLKEYATKMEIDNKTVSLYQILLIQFTYAIYNEIVLLMLLLIHKFIFILIGSYSNIIFFTINMVLLLNIVFVTFKNVKNLYLSFWKNDPNEK